jgi:hypothetical protein
MTIAEQALLRSIPIQVLLSAGHAALLEGTLSHFYSKEMAWNLGRLWNNSPNNGRWTHVKYG